MIDTRMTRIERLPAEAIQTGMTTDLFFVPKNYGSIIKFIISDMLRQQHLSVIIRSIRVIRVSIIGADQYFKVLKIFRTLMVSSPTT